MTQKTIRKDRLRNRKAILDAASHIFATEGFAVPLDRIADQAKVGRATLYRNFANRAELALAIFEQNVSSFEALAETLPQTPQGFRKMFDAIALTFANHAGLGQAFSTKEGVEALMPLRDRMIDVLDRYRVAGIAAGEVQRDIRRADLLLVLDTLGMGLALGDLDHRRAQAARVVALLFQGLDGPGQ